MSPARLLRFVVVLLPLALMPAFAQAGGPPPDDDNAPERRPPKVEPGRIGIDKPALPPPRLLNVEGLRSMMKEIGINDSTAARIVSQAIEFNGLLEKKLILVQREELNIKEALLSSNPDMKVIEPIVKRKAMVIGDIEAAQIRRDIAIRALLTAEQFEKWRSYMGRQPTRMDGSQQRGREPGEKRGRD